MFFDREMEGDRIFCGCANESCDVTSIDAYLESGCAVLLISEVKIPS